MKIEITKKVIVTELETVNTDKLTAIKGAYNDIESNSFTVYYKGVEIGDGTLNNRSNYAHVDLNVHNEKLESYLVNAIESRQIYLD
tara:strand:- start:101 stop:358 length:258 start_codon:yes stop_codon:yes gene_type:complete